MNLHPRLDLTIVRFSSEGDAMAELVAPAPGSVVVIDCTHLARFDEPALEALFELRHRLQGRHRAKVMLAIREATPHGPGMTRLIPARLPILLTQLPRYLTRSA